MKSAVCCQGLLGTERRAGDLVDVLKSHGGGLASTMWTSVNCTSEASAVRRSSRPDFGSANSLRTMFAQPGPAVSLV